MGKRARQRREREAHDDEISAARKTVLEVLATLE
jgi:hypothetical protein